MIFRQFLLTATSPSSQTVNVTTQVADNLEQFDWFTIDAALDGATGGVLDVYLQRYVPALDTWVDWVAFTQQAAGAGITRYTMDSRAASGEIVVVGSGSTPSLAADTMTCGHPGKKVRLVFSAGASTSAGAVQNVVLTGWKDT